MLSLGLPGLVCTTSCADPGRVYTTGPELHLHECVWTTEAFAAPGRVYTREDNADLYTPILQGPELHLDVSGHQDPELVWTCLHYMGAAGRVYTTEAHAAPSRLYYWVCQHWIGLWCTWTHTTEVCVAPGRGYSSGAWVAPGLGWTKEVCTSSGRVYSTEAWATPGSVFTTTKGVFTVLLLDVSTPTRWT